MNTKNISLNLSLLVVALASCGKKPIEPTRHPFTPVDNSQLPASFEDETPLVVAKPCDYWQSKEVASPTGDYRFAEDLKFGKDGLYGRFNMKDNPPLRYKGSEALLTDSEKQPPTIRGIHDTIKASLGEVPWYAKIWWLGKVLLNTDDKWKSSFPGMSYNDVKTKSDNAVKQLENLEIYYKNNPNGLNPPKRNDLDWLIAFRLKKVPEGLDEKLPGTYGDVAANLEEHALYKLFKEQTGVAIDKNNFLVASKYLQQRANLFIRTSVGAFDWNLARQDMRMSLAVLRESANEGSALNDGTFETKVCRFLIGQRVTAQLLTLKGFKSIELDAKGKAVRRFVPVVAGDKIGDNITYPSKDLPSIFATESSSEIIDSAWVEARRFEATDAHRTGNKGPNVRPKYGESVADFLKSMGFWLAVASQRDARVFETPAGMLEVRTADKVRVSVDLLKLSVGMFAVAANTFTDYVIAPDKAEVSLTILPTVKDNGEIFEDTPQNLANVGILSESAKDAYGSLAEPTEYELAVFGKETTESLYGASQSMSSLNNLVAFESLQRLKKKKAGSYDAVDTTGWDWQYLVDYLHHLGNKVKNGTLVSTSAE